MHRCNKCSNCKKLEQIKNRILSCINPPFSHADDGIIKVWNDSLEKYPCTGGKNVCK